MTEQGDLVEHWDRGAHTAILWGGYSLATIFTVSRFLARWHVVRRFYIEDAFALAAWLIITTYCILHQVLLLDLYEIIYSTVYAEDYQTLPARRNITRELEAKAASDMLGYSALWAVKFSFLFFFRRIYKVLDSWMKYWWIIMGLTLISWVATSIASFVYYALIDYDCMSSLFEYRPRCTEDHYWHNLALTNIDIARAATDIFTDVLITLIPATMLWKFRISWRRKLILGSVLLLTVVTLSLVIVRIYLLATDSDLGSVTLAMNWLNIEVYVAIMLLSIGSIRSVFARRNSKKRFTPPSESHHHAFRKSPRKWIYDLLSETEEKDADSDQPLFSQGATTWAMSVNDNMERVGRTDTERQ